MISRLPFVDEHTITIDADPDEVWPVLVDTLDRAFSRTGAARYARIVRSADVTSSGPRPLAAGSTVPGFRVVEAVAGAELALEGRHRFSSYELVFRLDQVDAGRTRLVAETRATFPGFTGAAYRLLVVRTGAHVVGVRRLLSAVKRRSEPHERSRT